MVKIPRLLKKTRAIRRIQDYMRCEFSEVRHTTLNPAGPGVIRIHLVPPELDSDYLHPSVAIINGADIIPVNFLWALMLAEMIRQVNQYDGFELSEEQIAYREEVITEIEHLNIGDYADMMRTPHRMDVMVSAMTKNGHWHCNQKCVHCYAAGQELSDEEELTTEQWKQILDKCRNIKLYGKLLKLTLDDGTGTDRTILS